MAVITLSKEYAAESDILAEKLARRLSYEIFDKQLIQHIAQEMEISSSESIPRPRIKALRLMKLVDDSVFKTLKEATSIPYGRINNTALFTVVKNLIEKAVQLDNVIIVGWGGQCILAGHPRTVHVRVVKNLEERISILKQQFGLDDRGARELIEKEERESSRFIETYFNRLWSDPHLYHLVINLSKVSFEQAVDIIETLVKDVDKF